MDYKTKGTVRGNTITLENEIPIRGRVTVIIRKEDEAITQNSILSYLKAK